MTLGSALGNAFGGAFGGRMTGRDAVAAAPAPASTYSVVFNGTTAYINCGTDASLEDIHAGAFTVDLWASHNPVNNNHQLIDKSQGNEDHNGWIFEGRRFSFKNRLYGIAAYDTQNANSRSVEYLNYDGTWYHHLMAFNQGVDNKIYFAIDGQWCTYAYQYDAQGTPSTDAGRPLLIGTYNQVAGIFHCGAMSWVRISSGIRYPIGVNFTPPDQCTAPAVDGTTVELWALDEGSGAVAGASVNAANDGTMTDCTWAECT